MNVPLLATKVYKPTPHLATISRTRLVEQMTAGLSGGLTLISAPAGYGKTTLLSAWLSQLDLPAAWLSLDEDDNNIARFFDYLIAAFQMIVPEFGQAIPTLHGAPEPVPIHFLLTSLIHQISNIPHEIVLILDDYHAISAQEVHHAVMFLLDHLPLNLHVAISSRTDPPLRVARLRARGDLNEVRARDLCFNLPEATDFFHTSMGLDLSPADIKKLVDKTEGWVAGLQLAAISLEGQADKSAFVRTFAGDDRHVADFLFEEVLHSLPEHVRSFLLETSILNRLCASLCQAVTGREDSRDILLSLEKSNLFLIPLDNRREWYRYHHLFADLMRLHLKRKYASGIPLLHLRASRWYEGQGFLNLAVTHTIKAGDIQRLENIVQTKTLAMLEVGESATVARWIDALPRDLVDQSLWLSVARGWTLLFSEKIEMVEPALQVADKLILDAQGDQEPVRRARGQIAVIRSYLADLQGDMVRVKAYASEALEYLAEDDQLAVAFASMMLTTAYNREGDTANARIALQKALNICETMPHSFTTIDTLCMWSKIQFLEGKLYESERILGKALAISEQNVRRGVRHFPIVGLVHVYRSQLLYQWNQLEDALMEVNLGLELLEPWGYKDCVIVGLICLTMIQNARGNVGLALETVVKAKRVSKDLPYWFNRVTAVEAWLNTLQGDSRQVTAWLKEQDILLQSEPVMHQDYEYRLLAKIWIARGDLSRAAFLLERLVHVADRSDSRDSLIRALVLQAVASFALDQEEQAFSSIRRAVELAEPGGYGRVFLDEGESVAHLLYRLAQEGTCSEYCLRLLDQFSKPIPSIESTSERAAEFIEPLSNRETEVLKLIAQGLTNQEVAQELFLSLYTIKSHARNIYGKLGVKNRTEAVVKARLLGILPN